MHEGGSDQVGRPQIVAEYHVALRYDNKLIETWTASDLQHVPLRENNSKPSGLDHDGTRSATWCNALATRESSHRWLLSQPFGACPETGSRDRGE